MNHPGRPLARVMVTGAQGFAGGWALSALAACSSAVAGVGRRKGADLVADVLDKGSLERAIRRFEPDTVLHLAGKTYLPEVAADPDAAARVNVDGTRNLVDALAAQAPKARLLLVSSCTVYGAPEEDSLPLAESAPLLASHAYGLQKIAAERIGEAAAGRGQDVLIARPFNHIGPGQDRRISVQHFAAALLRVKRGEAPPVLAVGNLAPRRDFLDVRDVVAAYLDILRLERPPLVVNVASGVSRAMGEILDAMAAILGIRVRTEPDPARVRSGDVPDLRGDASLLRATTGWRPSIAFEDTLRAILDDAASAPAGHGQA